MRTTCIRCWNPINWCESFDHFGHGDGEDCTHTPYIARALSEAGYEVEVLEDSMHNPIVLSISKESAGLITVVYSDTVPTGNRPGFCDPRRVLPADIVELLDRKFGPGEFFG